MGTREHRSDVWHSIAAVLVLSIVASSFASSAHALNAKYTSKRDSAAKSYVSALSAFGGQAGASGDRIHYRAALRRILLVTPDDKKAAGLAANFEPAVFFNSVHEKKGTPSALFNQDAAALGKIELDFAMKLAAIARSAATAGDEADRQEILAEAFRHAPYSMNLAKDLGLKWNQAFGWVDPPVYDKLMHNTWTYVYKKPYKVDDFSEVVKKMKEFFEKTIPDVQKYREIKGQRVIGISNVTDNMLEDKLVFQLTVQGRDLMMAFGVDTTDTGIIKLVLLKDQAGYAKVLTALGVPAAAVEKSAGIFVTKVDTLFAFQNVMQSGSGLEGTIFHESGHALLSSIFQHPPMWFHESIAMLCTGSKVEMRKDALGMNSYFVFGRPDAATRGELLGILANSRYSVNAMVSDENAFLAKSMEAYTTAHALGWTLYYSGVLPEVLKDLKELKEDGDPLNVLSKRLAVPKEKLDLAVIEFMAFLSGD
jgi:hypothetical protein